jgi:hypothetical protein
MGKEPAIIPAPKQLVWGSAVFPLYRCKTIVVKADELQLEATRLQKIMTDRGFAYDHKEARSSE